MGTMEECIKSYIAIAYRLIPELAGATRVLPAGTCESTPETVVRSYPNIVAFIGGRYRPCTFQKE